MGRAVERLAEELGSLSAEEWTELNAKWPAVQNTEVGAGDTADDSRDESTLTPENGS